MTFESSLNFCANITAQFNGGVFNVLSVWSRTKNVTMLNFYGSMCI